MTPATLHGLPTIDPSEAELRRTVVEAITGRRVGEALLVARIAKRRDDRGDWLACANGVAIAFDQAGGRAARLSLADSFDAAATLECAEPVLRDIEAALGIDLDPVDIVSSPPGDAVIVAIATDDGGTLVDALRLAIPLSLVLLPEPAALAPELVGHVALAATVAIAGPRIAPHDAAALTAGDCILLGRQPLAATLSVPGLAEISGTLDVAGHRFVCR